MHFTLKCKIFFWVSMSQDPRGRSEDHPPVSQNPAGNTDLHLYDCISLKECCFRLCIKHKGIPAQSHDAIMTLRIQRHKQMVQTEA